MNHAERMETANKIASKAVERYGDSILLAGVYGSAGFEEDVESSDLDMVFFVKDECALKGGSLVFKGMVVSCQAVKESVAREFVTTPSVNWPFWMGVIGNMKVIRGDASLAKRWIDMGRSVPFKRFREFLGAELPELVFEPYGHILSAIEKNDSSRIACDVREFLLDAGKAVCLMNAKPTAHGGYRGITETFEGFELPKNYAQIVPKLWNAREKEEIVPLAGELVWNFRKFAAGKGVEIVDVQRIEDFDM